jgi:hypothetical protein
VLEYLADAPAAAGGAPNELLGRPGQFGDPLVQGDGLGPQLLVQVTLKSTHGVHHEGVGCEVNTRRAGPQCTGTIFSLGIRVLPPASYIPVMRLPAVLFAVVTLAACASVGGAPPASFVRSNAEGRTTRTIDVREGLGRAASMRALTEVLGTRYSVEVTDSRAGFAMTAWEASLVHDGVPDPRYRSRFIAQFLGDDWSKLRLRHEANWARGDEWDVGYDAGQLDSMSAELRAKLGRRP